MEKTVKTDVLIVGAGPTGLSMAAQLIRYGIDFVIVDAKEGVTDLSKALAVHARTLEIYDQIGLARQAVEGGEIVQKATLMHDGKVSAQLEFGNLGGRLSPFPFVLIFEQSKTEQMLYNHLKSNGKDVQWKTGMASLTQHPNGVTAVCQTATGEMQTVEARYLVGCDGAGSPTRHLLGLGFEGSTSPRLFYVADVDLTFQTAPSSLIVTFGYDAFVLMIPMAGENHWRLIGNLPEYNEHPDREINYDEIENKVRQVVQRPLDITSVRWFSTYKVHTRHAEQFAKGRVFLAGDAAHIHTPAGGQGMNTGIQDAYNLAWKLAFVLKEQAGSLLLDSYNDERLANAKHLLESTDQFFEVATRDKWYLQVFRNAILPGLANIATRFDAVKEAIFPVISMIGINYRNNRLSQYPGSSGSRARAGDRMPYVRVGGASLYDRLRDPKFHLLIFSDGEENHDKPSTVWIDRDFDAIIDLAIIPLYPRVVAVFGIRKSFAVLLRPDNYIAFVKANFVPDDLRNYMNEFISPAA